MAQITKLQTVNTWVEDGVGVVQINYSEKRNTLGWQVHHDMLKVLDEYKDDKQVACVLFYGNEKYFSSGWAIDILATTSGAERQAFSDIALKLMITVYDYPKPTVCAVAGMCPGYALDIANFCDITIASKNAAFGNSQVKYGLNPMTHPMFRKMNIQRAKRLIFTGDPMGPEEALRVGLVDELTEVGQLFSTSMTLAKQIAERGSELAVNLKEMCLRVPNMDHIGATYYETRFTNDLLGRDSFKKLAEDGVRRIKEKRSKAVERLGKL
ncbi:hypothetical protein AYO21_01508 [Fonsecaea monophora]|uniref:Enoyl-CoA hydratase n=1 Tax=Fonsecaea monophora TaxID=254056 RepID=A0A177FJV0_9EURO|nr:hypothetical protein AYO21_01508 [Fonsecaea monophora]KAH0835281.1 3-hydroxybutyryl-CoA dehydratase [Fonsecaea pedrosoi]OAG44051.1 hypothetical protein AYO21_01508 [Fonsecaea monophora]